MEEDDLNENNSGFLLSMQMCNLSMPLWSMASAIKSRSIHFKINDVTHIPHSLKCKHANNCS